MNKTPLPLPRVEAFEKLGFGLFIHWGLYSQLGTGEWSRKIYNIPFDEYKKLFSSFSACDFNAESIVRMAKEAGMKYIVLTARHHEGFSLYDTRGLNDFDAPHSPAKRDIVREYVEACRKYDIAPFFYHTTLDWYWEGKKTPELAKEDFDRYLDYLKDSVEILCCNYGKIGGLWFDGNWSCPNADWKEDRLYATIRKYQPDAIIVNNTGLGRLGAIGNKEIDSVTFEQGEAKKINREGHTKYVAGEVCRTMNKHWGIGENDLNYISPGDVIEILASTRRHHANLLLNIGPTAQGGIPEYEKIILQKVGRWCKIYAEAIYSPKPAETCWCRGRDFILQEGNNYYYFVFDLTISGDGNVTPNAGGTGLRAINDFFPKVKSAHWMDNGEEILFSQNQSAGLLALRCTGFPYGTHTVVRVMKIITG